MRDVEKNNGRTARRSRSAHRVSLFADRLRREGLITHNQRTGMLEITRQGIDYLDQAS